MPRRAINITSARSVAEEHVAASLFIIIIIAITFSAIYILHYARALYHFEAHILSIMH